MSILDLAHEIIRLAGRVPGRDVEIAIVGARPGEKLVEDVLDRVEKPQPSSHPAIIVSRPQPPDRTELASTLADLRRLAEEDRGQELADRLRSLPGHAEMGSHVAEGIS